MHKDESLSRLASMGANVAQYVSFNLQFSQRYSCIKGFNINHAFDNPRQAIQALMDSSAHKSLNVRSYAPYSPQSKPFLYGLTNVDAVLEAISNNINIGLHSIVNETIDVHDSGVSGVYLNGLVEFSPHDTPRCVEKPGTLAMPYEMAATLLSTVYRIDNPFYNLKELKDRRVEWSLHPTPCGYLGERVLTWEVSDVLTSQSHAEVKWPNNFSNMIGDKAFGLLMAHIAGLRVPHSVVISREVAPFYFGDPVENTDGPWIRTCPRVQTPGLFSTFKGWHDPYKLMAKEDPEGSLIASIISMDGVPSVWAGASLTQSDGVILIEGKPGRGDDFMLGCNIGVDEVPSDIQQLIYEAHKKAMVLFGPVRFEWVYDGKEIWIVQMHCGASVSNNDVIVPGEAESWLNYDPNSGLDVLRSMISVIDNNVGIIVKGNIGVTSHVGDVLRKANVPSRIERHD